MRAMKIKLTYDSHFRLSYSSVVCACRIREGLENRFKSRRDILFSANRHNTWRSKTNSIEYIIASGILLARMSLNATLLPACIHYK